MIQLGVVSLQLLNFYVHV